MTADHRQQSRTARGRARVAAFAGALLAVLTGPAAATAPEPPPPADVASPGTSAPSGEVETYGEADATCREWGNGCQVCRRQPAGGWACSTAGIACLPEAVTCRQR